MKHTEMQKQQNAFHACGECFIHQCGRSLTRADLVDSSLSLLRKIQHVADFTGREAEGKRYSEAE